jgi:hypothetical protein
MATLYLVLTWAILGLIVGLLALGARLKPIAWSRTGRLWLLLLALGASLLGGLFGLWLFGRLFSAAAALWWAVVVVCVPVVYSRLKARVSGNQNT